MLEVLVNRLGGLSLPRKSVVRLTGSPDMALDVYRGRKTTNQQQQRFWQRANKRKNTCRTYGKGLTLYPSAILWLGHFKKDLAVVENIPAQFILVPLIV